MNLDTSAVPETDNKKLLDCIGIVEIEKPNLPLKSERCIATIASAGFARYLDNMLGSLDCNANCRETLKVVMVVNRDNECTQVAKKHGAVVIPCTSHGQMSTAIKSALYSIAHIVDAQQFLCLDADMLILDDLTPIFAKLEACSDRSILVCRDAMSIYSPDQAGNLEKVLYSLYKGKPDDFVQLLGKVNHENTYSFVVNDGLFAASSKALLHLDSLIRTWSSAYEWVSEFRRTLRNQFLFNLVLAHLQCGVELDYIYNVQLAWEDVEVEWMNEQVHVTWEEKKVSVLHFNGFSGKGKYPELRRLFIQTG